MKLSAWQSNYYHSASGTEIFTVCNSSPPKQLPKIYTIHSSLLPSIPSANAEWANKWQGKARAGGALMGFLSRHVQNRCTLKTRRALSKPSASERNPNRTEALAARARMPIKFDVKLITFGGHYSPAPPHLSKWKEKMQFPGINYGVMSIKHIYQPWLKTPNQKSWDRKQDLHMKCFIFLVVELCCFIISLVVEL